MFRSQILTSFFGRAPRSGPTWTGPDQVREAYDVVVVGGGVRAIAAARACAADGASVALFAAGEISAAADERAWPVIRSAYADPARTAAEAAAPQAVRRLLRGFGGRVAAEAAGCLTLAGSQDDFEKLGRAASALKLAGGEGWMVPEREVAALSPPVAGSGLGAAFYDPAALTVDADAFALLLAEQAAGHGAHLVPHAPSAAIARDGRRATGLEVAGRSVKADRIVLADDVAAIRLVREGKGRLSLIREERQILVTTAGAPAIGPALAIADLRVSRDHTGALIISGPAGGDALARRLVSIAPALGALLVVSDEPVTVWTGVDGRAQVGAAEIEGLWLALGFGRDALSLAQPAANCLAALIGGRPGGAFEPFAPTRRPHLQREEI